MIATHAFAKRTVAVLSWPARDLARCVRWSRAGPQVIAWDDNSTARDVGGLAGAEIMPWREWPWEGISALILSPGVPLTYPRPHEVVAHAKAAKVEVIGDVELFAREIRPDAEPGRAPVIAITGTNGKSTTTALVGHILPMPALTPRSAAISAIPCSNSPPLRSAYIYVLEMSSFRST